MGESQAVKGLGEDLFSEIQAHLFPLQEDLWVEKSKLFSRLQNISRAGHGGNACQKKAGPLRRTGITADMIWGQR